MSEKVETNDCEAVMSENAETETLTPVVEKKEPKEYQKPEQKKEDQLETRENQEELPDALKEIADTLKEKVNQGKDETITSTAEKEQLEMDKERLEPNEDEKKLEEDSLTEKSTAEKVDPAESVAQKVNETFLEQMEEPTAEEIAVANATESTEVAKEPTSLELEKDDGSIKNTLKDVKEPIKLAPENQENELKEAEKHRDSENIVKEPEDSENMVKETEDSENIEEELTENVAKEDKDTENADEAKASNQPEEADLDDVIDSQDSVDLVIDEKSDEQELLEDEKSQESTTKSETPMDVEEDNLNTTDDVVNATEEEKQKETATQYHEKDSSKDISEVSAVTQIEAVELDSDAQKKNEQKDIEEETNDDKDDEVQILEDPSASQVIEIDDEIDEDEQDQKAADVQATNAVQSNTNESKDTEKETDKKPEQSITVIEIDDDEEEEVEDQKLPDKTTTTDETESAVQDQSEEPTATADVTPIDLDGDRAVKPTPLDATYDQEEDDTEIKPAEKEIPPIGDTNAVEETTSDEKTGEDESLLEPTTDNDPKLSSPTPPLQDDTEADSNRTDDDVENSEVFYAKECINYECPRAHKQYFRAPQFTLSYFKVAKKKFKMQFICSTCYDKALDMYEEFCGLLTAKQPLLLKDIPCGRQEFVEIIDSSDEEDTDEKADKEKERVCFSAADCDLIEAELENSIKSVLANVRIQNQLTWSKSLLTARAHKLQEQNNLIDEELRQLQRKADNMHVSLYQCPKIKIRQLQPLDLNSGRPYTSEMPQLPPVGEICRPPINLNEAYYAVKNKAIASWVPCKISEQVDSAMGLQKNLKHYKIKFLKSQYQMLKTVSVKHLAYYNSPLVRLPIGTRVIAYFDATAMSRGKEKMMIQSAFYPGIVAEPLKPNNKYRYLIFYDDGYTQYVYHKDVRLVCHVSENVWEDVHPGSRDFIQKYLTQYSINRPMVQTQKGQSMTTESNGKWIYARVVDIDCSLIQMQFEGPKSHTEWIYRGSMRLGPVFKEYQKTLQKDAAMPISRLPRRTEPFIRYTEDEETTSTNQQKYWNSAETTRAVAKKSVSQRQEAAGVAVEATVAPSSSAKSQSAASAAAAAAAALTTVRHLNNSTIYVEDENKPKGKVVFYTAKRNLPPKPFRPHKCSTECLYKITHNLSAYSPLSKPLLSGWERLIIRQKIKKVVTYRSPCGRVQRNMKELRQYLRNTNNTLNVDNFDFNHETNCLAEYVIESVIVQKRDISGGQEKMAIPLVNYYDNTMPPECKYAAQRIPTEGVNLELGEEFLVGCDCDDDCSDKTKCACWQLTTSGAKYGNPNTPIDEIGYQYKRLYEHVPTGIYECNPRCKCKSNCLNRVVQHSLQMKLQVFKTSNRGWGLRCLNDVPRGSFICIYAGNLLTEAKANEGGLDAGDEYFAELDYIEVAEQIKEGYESEVEPPDAEDEEAYVPEGDEDEEFTPKIYVPRKIKPQRLTRGTSSLNNEEDSQERQVINFNPNADMNENSVRESSIRQLFGKDEACYVMDAKTIGNLGRYFNHSCSPNLFVQNVFVDTHDLRFPWVAFFALTHIRAGTELTWNYNYEVGVVPGKVLYCQCGAPNCRLRLL